jgi:DNA-binding transcriptional LysR family regulator
MNYTLSQLAVFDKVVETKSITKAANNLFMTQPAVSIQLRNFQKNFNTPLYESRGRGITITEFGQNIAQACKKILNETNELNRLSFAYDKILKGKLKIASASTGKYVIPYFLSNFLAQHSSIELHLDVSNKSAVLESLERNEFDFAVISVIPENSSLNEELLIENKLFLTGKSSTNFAHKPQIFREEGSATRSAMEQFFKNRESQNKKIILQSNEAVKQAVLSDLGISILPLIGIKNELINGQIHIIPQRGLPYITNWRLVWLKNKILSPVAKEFLTFIRNNKAQIIKDNFSWYTSYT